MPIDFEAAYMKRAALLVMHYQLDVFEILFGGEHAPLIHRCNDLIAAWRSAERPLMFANVALGQAYEHAPPATNRQISPYVSAGRFRQGLPVSGLAVEASDPLYACPRASVFVGTSLDADLRARKVSTLVMAGISTTGVVLSSVAWACDADYDVRVVESCCYDPDEAAHEALFRSGFGGRCDVL